MRILDRRRRAATPAEGSPERLEQLRQEIIRLGPWHLDVDVVPGLTTSAFLDAPEGTYTGSGELDPRQINFVDPRGFTQLIDRIWGKGGLDGRSFLDCACNAGAYSFLAREAGAGRCFGFDVREHWIAQARFLAKNRAGPSDRTKFEVLDLYDLPSRGVGAFDITLFKGIFYHLPDPISGLRIAADMTRELIIVDTATRPDMPPGTLTVSKESREAMMSGVHGLNWRPSGPDVMRPVLRWMGFKDVRVDFATGPQGPKRLGRMRVLAARQPGLLDRFEAVEPTEYFGTGEAE